MASYGSYVDPHFDHIFLQNVHISANDQNGFRLMSKQASLYISNGFNPLRRPCFLLQDIWIYLDTSGSYKYDA